MSGLPEYRYKARQPNGALYVFEYEPTITTIPGVYKGTKGRYVIGPPIPFWESEGWQKAIEYPANDGWRYGQTKPGELFPDEWPGWRESLEAI